MSYLRNQSCQKNPEMISGRLFYRNLSFLFSQKTNDLLPDLIAHLPESREFFLVTAQDRRRGSGKPMCTRRAPPKKTGQLSAAWSQRVMTESNCWPVNSSSPLDRWREMSISSSAITFGTSGCTEGRIGPRGKGLDLPGQVLIDQSLGHLAAGAVFRADKKNSLHKNPRPVFSFGAIDSGGRLSGYPGEEPFNDYIRNSFLNLKKA